MTDEIKVNIGVDIEITLVTISKTLTRVDWKVSDLDTIWHLLGYVHVYDDGKACTARGVAVGQRCMDMHQSLDHAVTNMVTRMAHEGLRNNAIVRLSGRRVRDQRTEDDVRGAS